MYSKMKVINRIVDANINRLKEGLRVGEEVARFIIESQALVSDFKSIRHDIDRTFKNAGSSNTRLILIKERNSLLDAGKNIHIKELNRGNFFR